MAIELQSVLNKEFWDIQIGGFFFTSEVSEDLLARQKEIYDGAIPSGNSVAMLNLLRLFQLTGNEDYEKKAEIINIVFADNVRATPSAYSFLLIAIDYAIGPTYSLVVAGESVDGETISMIQGLKSQYLPNKSFIFRPTEEEIPLIDQFSNYIQFFDKFQGNATAYVCINKTCKAPTNDLQKALGYMNPEWNKEGD